MLVCGDVVYAQTWQVLTLKNCLEPLSYASTAYFVAWLYFPFDCFVKIWATCKNFWGKWITAPHPPGKKLPVRLFLQRFRVQKTLLKSLTYSAWYSCTNVNLKIYLGGGGGGWGYSGFQVTGMVEWGQKSNPQKIPCQVSEPWKFPEIVKWYNTKNLQNVLTKENSYLNQSSHPKHTCTKCTNTHTKRSNRVMKNISNKFHQRALTIKFVGDFRRHRI